MIHTKTPIIKHKVGLFNLAEELGYVSRACKVKGVSHDTLNRYQELVEEGGIDNQIKKSRRTTNKKRIDEATEAAVLAYTIDQPSHGQHRASNELSKTGVFILSCGFLAI